MSIVRANDPKEFKLLKQRCLIKTLKRRYDGDVNTKK